jgi:hypothetical protein
MKKLLFTLALTLASFASQADVLATMRTQHEEFKPERKTVEGTLSVTDETSPYCSQLNGKIAFVRDDGGPVRFGCWKFYNNMVMWMQPGYQALFDTTSFAIQPGKTINPVTPVPAPKSKSKPEDAAFYAMKVLCASDHPTAACDDLPHVMTVFYGEAAKPDQMLKPYKNRAECSRLGALLKEDRKFITVITCTPVKP